LKNVAYYVKLRNAYGIGSITVHAGREGVGRCISETVVEGVVEGVDDSIAKQTMKRGWMTGTEKRSQIISSPKHTIVLHIDSLH
jgi:hypothetical protein